ncbi:hypothetical protein C7K25_05675 [Gulosibacter molinativorax]|uniref:BON domain-containing protein n=1 Tax=Gulosibacter molinativorax TaxID=256821 RepID=A0ABT7C6N3_9MICO|nr:hypothetical protein [Gulosibacter molinativorax]
MLSLAPRLGPAQDLSPLIVAVIEQEEESQQHEEHEQAIENRDPTRGDRVAVEREEPRRDRGESDRAEQLLPDEVQQRHCKRAEYCDGDAPRERVLRAEDEHPPADEIFTEGWMHDIRRVGRISIDVSRGKQVATVLGPLRLVAEVRERPAVEHVVDLVEHEVCGMPEADEPRERPDERDDANEDPFGSSLQLRGRRPPLPEIVGPGTGRRLDAP